MNDSIKPRQKRKLSSSDEDVRDKITKRLARRRHRSFSSTSSSEMLVSSSANPDSTRTSSRARSWPDHSSNSSTPSTPSISSAEPLSAASRLSSGLDTSGFSTRPGSSASTLSMPSAASSVSLQNVPAPPSSPGEVNNRRSMPVSLAEYLQQQEAINCALRNLSLSKKKKK